MRAVVFGSAAIENYGFCKEYIEQADTIICCDGGLEHAKKLAIVPDYIVGDFDSVGEATFVEFQGKDIPIHQFPTHKDETDMQLGIRLALELGGTDVTIIGGIGNRFDHTLANAHLLLWLLKQGIQARLVDERNVVELMEKEMILSGNVGDLVSTIPLSMEVKGLTLEGVAYPLTNYDLRLDDELIAVSNVLTKKTAKITAKDGYLFVIRAKD